MCVCVFFVVRSGLEIRANYACIRVRNDQSDLNRYYFSIAFHVVHIYLIILVIIRMYELKYYYFSV
jgi:hypothetical protein